ncbi:MAG: hypothetical protein U1E28_19460 [Beijerinckiaceae bacterium]
MTDASTRSLYEIKRDAERSRIELAETVDRLKTSVAGARDRLAPDAIKARISDRLSNAARENPTQALAVGALAAWPLFRLARAIPLPLALVGAGLALTNSKSAREFATTSLQQGRMRAHDLRDASSGAMDAAAARVAEAAGRVAETARSTADMIGAAASDAVAGLTDTSEDVADRAAQWAEQAVDQGAGLGVAMGAQAKARANDLGAATRQVGGAAAAGASQALEWVANNPALIGGFGLLIGAFIASAIPATAVERQVGETVKGGVKAAAAAEMARAAGAVMRAATAGLSKDKGETDAMHGRHDERFGSASQSAAAAPGEDDRDASNIRGG